MRDPVRDTAEDTGKLFRQAARAGSVPVVDGQVEYREEST